LETRNKNITKMHGQQHIKISTFQLQD